MERFNPVGIKISLRILIILKSNIAKKQKLLTETNIIIPKQNSCKASNAKAKLLSVWNTQISAIYPKKTKSPINNENNIRIFFIYI